MMFKSKKLFLLLMLLLGILTLPGCRAGLGAIPRGWSGVTIVDDILFVGSMGGELVAVNAVDGSRPWEPVLLESPVSVSGGFLSCGPAATTVVVYGTPLVVEDSIYIGGYIPLSGRSNGMVFSLDLGRDEPSWLYPKQGVLNGGIVGGFAFSKGSIYFASSDGNVYALEAKGLFEKWEKPFETGDKIWATPAIDGDILYIGSFDKKLYALNANDGKEKWQFDTEGAIVSTPLIYDGAVYFGSFDRYFYALNVSDGGLKWKFMADNWFWAKPVIHNGVVYVSNLDGKVYALDAESGDNPDWFDLGSPISSTPVLVGNLLIVATEEGKIYSINTSNNQQNLLVDLKKDETADEKRKKKVTASLAADKGIVYIHTAEDVLYALNVETRLDVWRPIKLSGK